MILEIRPFARHILRDSSELGKWMNAPTATLRKARRWNLLPNNILPEDFLKERSQEIELMLIALMEGAWRPDEDWRTFARLLIAHRLRMKKVSLFHGRFAEWRDKILTWQATGGTYKQQKALRDFAISVLAAKPKDPYELGCARLIMSLTDQNQDAALVYPLHWIRATLATQDRAPLFGMASFQVEHQQQKRILATLIRSDVSKA